MGSFLGGIVGSIIAKVIGWLALIGIGKKEQAAADTSATLATVERENEAGAQQRDTEADLNAGKF